MSDAPHPLHSLLLDCLRQNPSALADDDLARLSQADWERLRDMARVQRISALLHSRVRTLPRIHAAMPADIRQDLAAAYQERTMRNLFLSSELQQITKALQAESIPVMVLKGMHLIADVYAEVGMREMDDIDLLVPRAALQPAADILQSLGYASKEPLDIPQWSADVHHLPRMLNRNNTVVEVHWNITWPRDQYSLSDLDSLWERARPLRIADVEVWGLSREDLLLHLCIHASFQHMFYTGLRPSCDIAAAIQAYRTELDWSQVVARACQWEWHTGVYLVLRLAQACLDSEVPAATLSALKPARDDEAFQAAYTMLWTIESDVSALPRNLARLWHRTSRAEKVLDVLRALTPSRARVAKEYRLAAGSSLIWLHYPRYIRDLLQRHYTAWRQLQQSDPEVRAMALSKSVLMDWLYQD